ncbi:hypothetical protein OF83DRAFT_1089417, partial [Amylostereum chailletii]
MSPMTQVTPKSSQTRQVYSSELKMLCLEGSEPRRQFSKDSPCPTCLGPASYFVANAPTVAGKWMGVSPAPSRGGFPPRCLFLLNKSQGSKPTGRRSLRRLIDPSPLRAMQPAFLAYATPKTPKGSQSSVAPDSDAGEPLALPVQPRLKAKKADDTVPAAAAGSESDPELVGDPSRKLFVKIYQHPPWNNKAIRYPVPSRKSFTLADHPGLMKHFYVLESRTHWQLWDHKRVEWGLKVRADEPVALDPDAKSIVGRVHCVTECWRFAREIARGVLELSHERK